MASYKLANLGDFGALTQKDALNRITSWLPQVPFAISARLAALPASPGGLVSWIRWI